MTSLRQLSCKTMLILFRTVPSSLFASRPTTRLKCQQAPTDDAQNVIQELVFYTAKELLSFLIYTNRNLGTYVGMILRMWDNGGRSVQLDQIKFIDMDSQSRESEFNVVSWEIRKGSNSSFGCVTEMWTRR